MTRVEELGLALAEIGKHAADMQSQGDVHHDACLWCETAVLLSRVVNFGKSERAVQLQEMR